MNPTPNPSQPNRRFSRNTNQSRAPYHAGAHTPGTPHTGHAPAHHAPHTSQPTRAGGMRSPYRRGAATPSGTPHAPGRRQPGQRPPHGGNRTSGQFRSRHEKPPQLTMRDSVALRDVPDYDPPAPDADTVRVIPLGGVEEVGRNMLAIETAEGIIISDIGFQFVAEDDAPGVDYILPNIRYLEKNKDRIKAAFITHGHLDHIGGIPFIMERIGNPPLYTQYLTSLMVKKRQEEFPHLPALNITVIEPGVTVTVGTIRVKTFPVTHSIPDSMGIAIETKHGNVVISGDLRLEHEDGIPTPKEEKVWGKVGEDKNIIFIGDSTNAEKDGFSIPEARVYETIEDIIKTVKSRLIIGTFASQFERMVHIIKTAEKYGKKVVTEGRSIRTNLEIAQYAKIFEPKPGTIISAQDIDQYPADKIIIICTGAQGEESAALMRIATKKHKFITMSERDTVVLSSSVIPGNELSVQKLKDNLYRYNLTLIHYRSSDVHSTGHGNTGELVWIRKQVKPTFFMPAYGYHSMLRCHANAQINAGFPRDHVIMPDNGSVIDIVNGTELKIHKDKVPSGPMMVDGFAIGDVQEVVIRDRKELAQDGMFVIIATVNLKTGKLRKSPDIISRGFVYIRESQDLFSESRLLIKKTVEDMVAGMNPIDLEMVKGNLVDTVGRYLFQKTSKHPMVIPVLIGV